MVGLMRLLLIRHGQTPANVSGRFDTTHPGHSLTALGEAQAARLPTAMAGQQIDAIYASTLIRTSLTAAPLAAARSLNTEVRTGLHEIEAGVLENRNDQQSIRIYLETVYSWVAGDRDVAMPGGPDGHDFFGRFTADITDIASRCAETIAVFSHGAAIRFWVAATALNVPPKFAEERELINTGIISLDGSFEDGWSLTDWTGRPAESSDAQQPLRDATGESLSTARSDTTV